MSEQPATRPSVFMLSPLMRHFLMHRKEQGLTTFDAVVLLTMHDYLDLVQFTPTKLDVVSLKYDLDRGHLNTSLQRLTDAQYLHCGARDPDAPEHARGKRPYWYRLPWSMPRK